MTPYSLIALRYSLISLALAAAPAYADDDVFPISKNIRHISINLATGERTINQTGTAPRNGTILWDCTDSPPFAGSAQSYERLDWGDLDPAVASSVSAFQFSYCSSSWTPDRNNGNVSLELHFYASENGNNTPSPPSTAIFSMTLNGLPGDDSCVEFDFLCWQVDIDLAQACAIDPNFPCTLGLGSAQDLDGDGLVDFGYGMFVTAVGSDCHGTPGMCGPQYAYPGPDPVGAPGATADYNRYQPPGKWAVGNAGYIGTYNNGAQIYLQLRGSPPQSCPASTNPTDCSCADNNNDGRVDLADLAALIANYGATGPNLPGDCATPCGSIDLADLGYTLSRYGLTGCAVP